MYVVLTTQSTIRHQSIPEHNNKSTIDTLSQ